MKSRIMLAVLCLTMLVTASLNAQTTETDRETFVKLANDFRAKHKIPGLAFALGHKGKIVTAEGIGMSDLENGVKATEDTVFRMASISKPITATAIFQLIEAGKIKLDDPIQKHCPEYPTKKHELTIRHLLCHQGGVRHYKFPGESAGKKHFMTIAASLSLFRDDPLKFEPGKSYSYTTYGYSLLGRAVETASGKSFREYVKENIFESAGMESAGLDDWFRIIPNRTRGYTTVTRGMKMRMPNELKSILEVGAVVNCQLHDTSMKVPGGGMICSPTDLVKFGQAMLANRLIKKESRQLAWTDQKTSTGKSNGYGLGWGVRNQGTQFISHSGGQSGTSTMLVILPEHELVIAVMCNLQGVPAIDLARALGESQLGKQKD